jgi:hypothetical protein
LVRRIAWLTVLLFAVAACGSKPPETQSGAQFTQPAGGAARVTKPAGPTTTVKNQPDCKAYQGFSFAASGFVLSSPAKKTEALKAVEATAPKLKQANGQLSAQVDQTVELMRKTVLGQTTPADTEAYKKVSTDLANWFKTNCL